MTARAGRGRWVVVLLLLAVLVWAAAVPTWVSAAGTSVLTGTVEVRVPGTRAAPGMVGAALALAAAGAALALAGRLGRWVVMTVVLLCGAVVAWSAVALLANPGPVARQAVAAATGVDHLVGTPRSTAAP
ncbi:MAG: Trp biosynthesis-associated membrane protein, partial [Cellulomonas sp.]|nr:Trp biosynthesis-associated membrane protein [Cellulomonas sp.]